MAKKKDLHPNEGYFQYIDPVLGLIDIPQPKDVALEKKKKDKQPKVYKTKHLFRYTGCLFQFGKLVASNFDASTYAVSEKQARNNILFQAKKFLNLVPSAKVELEHDYLELIN